MVKVDGRSKPRPGLEEQRRHIVDTATRLFAQQNARAVSVSEVCRAADVSRPTFYRCFADKEALLEWVYDLAIHRYVEQIDLRAVRAGLPSERALRELVDRIVEQVLAAPDLARFVFVEYGDPASPARALVNERFRDTAGRLAAGLRAATGHAPSVRYVESVLASIQWILFETLRAGAGAEQVAQAKQAVWEAALGMLRVAEAGAAQA